MTFQLYRHYDSSGALLYVGQTLNPLGRLAVHKTKSAWFSLIAKIEIQNFDTRELVIDAEKIAILTERPLHNKYRPKPLVEITLQCDGDDPLKEITRVRQCLGAMNTRSREDFAKRAKCGVATIHRIANDLEYLPSMRTFHKLIARVK